jgi:Probable cobalt transporter subunit (CbtB)
MSTSSIAGPGSMAAPVAIRVPATALLLVSTLLVALAIYYFVGVDQGAVSVFGSDTHVHEFVHDSRHFLGFPCH